MVWEPQPGQEGNHTFTIYTTRHRLVESTPGDFETTVVRTTTEITLTVANLTTAPTITENSFTLSRAIDGNKSANVEVEGEITFHDSLQGVEVQLLFYDTVNPDKKIIANVPVEIEQSNPYNGTFRHALDVIELEDLLRGATLATPLDFTTVSIKATPRTWDPNKNQDSDPEIEGDFILHDGNLEDGTTDQSVLLTGIILDPNLDTHAVVASLGFEQFHDDGTNHITAIPTLVGNVTNDGRVDDLLVRFYLGSDNAGTELGKTRTDDDGKFSFTVDSYEDLGFIATDTSKSVSIYAEVEERGPLDRLGDETADGGMSFDDGIVLRNAAPDQFVLEQAGTSSNPFIKGTISWSQHDAAFDHEDVTIEFSRGATFGTVEGGCGY